MTRYMLSDLGKSRANIHIRAEKIMVFVSVPVLKRRELLRDGREESDDDTNRRGFHVVTKFVDNLSVLLAVSNVKEESGWFLQGSDSDSRIAFPPKRQAGSKQP